MNKNKIVIGVLVVIALIFAVLYFTKGTNLGGIAHWQKESFLQGLNVGTGQQFSVSNAGALTSSGANVLSGALTQSGAATLSGATTFTGTAQISNGGTTTSTLIIGKSFPSGTGWYAGCLKIGDSGGATSTPVYITVTGTTVSATTTKPAVCQ